MKKAKSNPFPMVGDRIQVLVAYPALIKGKIIDIPVGAEGTVTRFQMSDDGKVPISCTANFEPTELYHQVDVATGYVATHKKQGTLDGLSPELLVMACALFGGGR